jgi:O-antigen/teichoic acid export membrane protein
LREAAGAQAAWACQASGSRPAPPQGSGRMAADARVRAEGSLRVAVRRLSSQRLISTVSRRFGWGLGDQAISSLTNYAVSFYLVHVLGAADLGAFSLCFVTYGFALNASRGLATDPLMVRFSGIDIQRWRRAVGYATGTALSVGISCGALVLIAAAIISGPARGAFFALGLTLPGAMLQDSWRYSFFVLGKGSQAFLNDLTWGILLAAGILALRFTGHTDVFWAVLAWGASASVAAALGPLQARVIPKVFGARVWLRQHGDLGFRYLAEGTSGAASYQIRAYGMSLLLGLTALGYMQATSTLVGPMVILSAAMSLVLIPEGVRVLQRGPAELRSFCILVSLGMAAIAAVWTIFLMVSLPRGLGHLLLGQIWHPTYALVLPTMLATVAGNITVGCGVGLHALASSKRSLNLMLISSVVWVLASLAGGYEWGVAGALWTSAIVNWIFTVPYWWQFQVALREYRGASVSVSPIRSKIGRHARQR